MESIAVAASNAIIKGLIEGLYQVILNEDMRIIRSGGGHIMIKAKQELQELQKHIDDASFFLAGGSDNPDLRQWINEARKIAFCLEDQITMYAIPGAQNLESFVMKKHIGMATIRDLIAKVEEFKTRMPTDVTRPENIDRLTINTLVKNTPTEIFVGMDDGMKSIEEFLGGNQKVFFITGEQGSGKSRLVQELYKVHEARGDFTLLPRVNVTKTRSVADLLRKVIEDLPSSGPSVVDSETIGEFELLKTIHDRFRDKRYLLMLDDVQDTSVLYNMTHFLKGFDGKIVCTTRNANLGGDWDTERVCGLEEKAAPQLFCGLEGKAARQLFRHVALPMFDPNAGTVTDQGIDSATDNFFYGALEKELYESQQGLPESELNQRVQRRMTIETDMLKKCKGNPRNICTLGAQLAAIPPPCTVEKWEEFCKRMDDVLTTIDPPLLFQDAKLPSHLSPCFLYCLAFPENSEVPEISGIPKRKLIRLWTAEGFVHDSPYETQEQVAEGMLQELIDKKLLVVKKYSFNGEVLKCSVNEHIRHKALDMCDLQKFCRFVPGDEPDQVAPSNRKECFPMPLGVFWKKRALSDRYRMVAVHGEAEEIPKTLGKDIRLRSLLYFETRRVHRPKIGRLKFRRPYMLLRSLELQGTQLDNLPASIGYLVCLRYLGLRNTQLESLPTSLQRLKFLMCLDIRDTNIVEVDDVSAFTQMRYLHLAKSFWGQPVRILQGLQFLSSLMTLSGVACSSHSPEDQTSRASIEQELLSLKLLRKLSVKNVTSASKDDLCRAINGMKFLQSLTLTCGRDQQFDMSSVAIKKHLLRLKLGGNMGSFLRQVSMMQSIAYLYLWDSNLTDDPLQHMQHLPNLVLLSLYCAYTGATMGCEDNCYPKLMKLSIIDLKALHTCKIGIGAMRCLEELVLAACDELRSAPEELGKLPVLREVQFAEMPAEFGKKLEAINGRRAAGLQKFQVVPVQLPLHYLREEDQN